MVGFLHHGETLIQVSHDIHLCSSFPIAKLGGMNGARGARALSPALKVSRDAVGCVMATVQGCVRVIHVKGK